MNVTKRVLLFYVWIGLSVSLSMGPVPVWSQTTEEIILKMQRQMEELQNHVNDLEKRNKELENRLNQQEQTAADQVEKMEQMEQVSLSAPQEAINTKFGVDLYGFLKFDAAYDTARTDAGDFARWVESEATNRNDDQFNMTANQSRFGLQFNGPDFGNAKSGGRVEVDFYGGGAENKSHLMMRHAYLEMNWPEYDFSILAGQTSDVISPLVPNTLNYAVNWWVGDIGYRRPQFRLSKGFDVGENSSLLLQGALARTIGDDWGFDPGDTGEDAGFPTLQSRLAYSVPLWMDTPATLGISGHWGQEEYDADNADHGKDFDTWSASIDLVLPLMEKLMLKGEWFIGENLDAYLGGIAQGVNRALLEEIESTGGWAALSMGPFDKWQFTLGAAIDDPRDRDLNAGDRARNYSLFGNTFYSINEAMLVGFEVSYWDTEYKYQTDGDSVRLQTSLIYKF